MDRGAKCADEYTRGRKSEVVRSEGREPIAKTNVGAADTWMN